MILLCCDIAETLVKISLASNPYSHVLMPSLPLGKMPTAAVVFFYSNFVSGGGNL